MSKLDNQLIIQGIIKEDSKIISHLLAETSRISKSTLFAMGLGKRDIEEAVLDSMVIFIDKVKTGQIEDQGIDLLHYLVKTVKMRAHYYLRKRSPLVLDANKIPEINSNHENQEFARWDIVLESLEKLPTQRRKLIELTFIEGYSDKEILEKNLSEYTTVSSLKTQRYKAIRQLTKIVNDVMGQ